MDVYRVIVLVHGTPNVIGTPVLRIASRLATWFTATDLGIGIMLSQHVFAMVSVMKVIK